MFALELEDTIYVTTDKGACSAGTVLQLLRQTHWASSRSLETMKMAMDNSLCFYLMDGVKLIGFARVITDMTTFAYLCDVVIDSEQQGNGSGSQLIHSVLNHPTLKTVPQWRLKTTYASSFYQRFGFQKVSENITHMEYYPPQ